MFKCSHIFSLLMHGAVSAQKNIQTIYVNTYNTRNVAKSFLNERAKLDFHY